MPEELSQDDINAILSGGGGSDGNSPDEASESGSFPAVPPDPDTVLHLLQSVNVPLRISLGRCSMRHGEKVKGVSLGLQCSAGDEVEVEVGGAPFGRGRIIREEGCLRLQLTARYPARRPQTPRDEEGHDA